MQQAYQQQMYAQQQAYMQQQAQIAQEKAQTKARKIEYLKQRRANELAKKNGTKSPGQADSPQNLTAAAR